MSEYDLIVLGGMITHPLGTYPADVAVEDGKIVRIASDLSHAESSNRINADGLFILPGCIDSHMHLWEEGFKVASDFRDGTRAAIAGGVTTILDHPLTLPEVLNVDIFENKKVIGEATSYCDFGMHGGVGEYNLSNLQNMWDAGCTALKIFMCESGTKVSYVPSGRLQEVFRTIGSFGGTAILHAESESMLQHNRKALESAGRKDYKAFVDWRTPDVEIEAIRRALFLLKDTGTRAVFLHTTVPEGVKLVLEARQAGLDVWVETCPHNLYLTTEHLQAHGPWVTFAPPVRAPGFAEGLWQQLASGLIFTMGSDHNPVERSRKMKGEKDIWRGHFGIPGAETMLPLMLNAVVQGRLSLEQITAILSENPARLYGLYPQKGTIQVGSDGDFTIVDLSQEYQFEANKMHTSCGWIPYEGWKITGKVISTIVRGKEVMHEGAILGEPGYGQFVRRSILSGPLNPLSSFQDS